MKGIASKIIEEARQEEKAILEESSARIAALKKEAMENEKEQRRLEEEGLKEVYLREIKRFVSRGKIDAAKEILRAKTALIEGSLGELKSRLLEDVPLYRSFLMEVMLKGIQTGREEIILSQEDRSLADEKFLRELNTRAKEKLEKETKIILSEESRDTGGGFFLREEKREFNATIDVVIEAVAEQHQLDIIHLFFSGESGEDETETSQ